MAHLSFLEIYLRVMSGSGNPLVVKTLDCEANSAPVSAPCAGSLLKQHLTLFKNGRYEVAGKDNADSRPGCIRVLCKIFNALTTFLSPTGCSQSTHRLG